MSCACFLKLCWLQFLDLHKLTLSVYSFIIIVEMPGPGNNKAAAHGSWYSGTHSTTGSIWWQALHWLQSAAIWTVTQLLLSEWCICNVQVSVLCSNHWCCACIAGSMAWYALDLLGSGQGIVCANRLQKRVVSDWEVNAHHGLFGNCVFLVHVLFWYACLHLRVGCCRLRHES